MNLYKQFLGLFQTQKTYYGNIASISLGKISVNVIGGGIIDIFNENHGNEFAVNDSVWLVYSENEWKISKAPSFTATEILV